MRKDSWKESEIRFLKENYSKLTNTNIAVKLKKSPATVARKASLFGLRKDSPQAIPTRSLVGLQSIKIDNRTTIYVKGGIDPEEAKRNFIEKYNYAVR
jgi:hypothetical protein